MIIRTRAYPRAGLVGNPSDGYHGKTVSFTFRNFRAEAILYETPRLEILPADRDRLTYDSVATLAEDVGDHGYYGGVRLLKATIKRFHDHCAEHGIVLPRRNFTLGYDTDIPSRVGLAGSSAIITACLRALTTFYGVEIPRPVQANLIWSVETRELEIPAGLQDRVAQVYGGLVHMNFDKAIMERQGHGEYEELDPRLLPPLYIAYRTNWSEGTEVFHNDIRARWLRGEPEVVEAMRFWADLAQRVRDALVRGEGTTIGPMLDANFDRRREIYQISAGNLRMVELARSVGASAKFTGSGGAIVGTCPDDGAFDRLRERMESIGATCIRPEIDRPGEENPS